MKDCGYYLDLAEKHLGAGNDAAAAECVRAARSLEPAHARLAPTSSLVLRREGNYIEAIKELQISRRRAPDELCDAPKLGTVPDVLKRSHRRIDATSGDESAPPRSRREVRQWLKLLKPVKFFAELPSYFPDDDDDAPGTAQTSAAPKAASPLERVARVVRAVHFEDGEHIFADGDVGKSFYVIYQGLVDISKAPDEKPNGPEVVLKRLQPGDTFGETALTSDDSRRTASARAAGKHVILFQLLKDDYIEITEAHDLMEVRDQLQRLAACPIFSSWSPARVHDMAKHVVVKKLEAHSVLLQADCAVPELSIIKAGVVELLKAVDEVAARPLALGATYTDEPPGIWVIQRNWRDCEASEPAAATTPMLVGVLGTGQVFGELAVLAAKKTSPITAVALTNVELPEAASDHWLTWERYTIPASAIVSLGLSFDVAMVQFLNESLILHNPPSQKLAQYLRNRVTWKLAKERALGDVMSAKWLSARGASTKDPAPAALPSAQRHSSGRIQKPPLSKSKAASSSDATGQLPTRVSRQGASATRAALFKAAQVLADKDGDL